MRKSMNREAIVAFRKSLFLLLVMIALSVAYGSYAVASEDKRPNILIILSDDQRYDTLNSQFMPNTQAMIVDQGIWFEQGFVTTPLCAPSRSSILTGKYGRNTGVLRNSELLMERTFVQRLHRAGYHTGLVGKFLNPWDGSPWPGFDYWVAFPGGASRYFDPLLNINGRRREVPGYMTYILRDYALQFLNQVPEDQPFVLLFTPNAPHGPFTPAPEHEDLYPDLPPHRPPNFNEEDVSDKPAWIQALPRFSRMQINAIDDRQRRQVQMLKSLDDAVGDILTQLEKQRKLDNTFVVYLSDNGFFWGEHRIPMGKNRVYEPSQRVPFAIRYPKLIGKPRVESRLVANIDLAPTIYELAGVPTPPDVDGRSLIPLLKGTDEWRDALVLEGAPNPPYEAIHTGRFVYVESENDRPELYDLEVDPFQLDNVVDDPRYMRVAHYLMHRLHRKID